MSSKKGVKQAKPTIVVMQGSGQANIKAALSRLNKKMVLVVSALAVLVIAAVLVFTLRHEKPVGEPQRVSGKQLASVEATRLKDSKPASSASFDDRANYYTSLIRQQYDAGDIAGAMTTYKAFQTTIGNNQIKSDDLYVTMAQVYAKQGNKTAAGQMLDKAVAIDNKISDEDSRSEYLQTLQALRTEINK